MYFIVCWLGPTIYKWFANHIFYQALVRRMGREAAAGIVGFGIGAAAGFVAARAATPAGAAPVSKPRFQGVISRYRVVATWEARSIQLSPAFVAQTTTGDELWCWLAPDRGCWAITKMWAKPEGVSFEIARLGWASMRIYRLGRLVAEFPEVLMGNRVYPGYWSTTETV